jgi:CubicO group peptidase (beta-lactamase class C family)
MKNFPYFLYASIIVVKLLIITHLSNAQNPSERLKSIENAWPTIDKLFKDYAKKNQFPGLVYGLVVDGKLVFSGQSGFSNLNAKIAANNQSVFRIASMTKSLAAMAIVKLRDEGKLRLDDPVYLYIPEMKNQLYPTKDSPDITVRHLLTHAAGFPEDNPWGDRQLAAKDEELLKDIQSGLSYSNPPGVAYEYSNLGFAMLGLIIKKVSGKPYQQYINEHIFSPLGMKNTYWEYSQVPDNQLARGYRWLKEQWVEQPMLPDGAYGAMGGLLTSIEDFSKYVIFCQSAWDYNSNADNNKILKASSLREMQMPWNFSALSSQFKYPNGRLCPQVSAYGYGLRWTKDCYQRIMVGHSGGLPGFGSNWRILPDYNIGIISFANLTYASAGLVNLAALDTLIHLAQLKPRPIPVSPILKQRSNELLKLLPDWNNAPASGIFADNFFLDYFPDMLRAEAQDIFKKAGKILKINEIIPENNLRGTIILEGENAHIEVFFTLSPENPPLIQEYHINLVKKEKK